MIRPNVVTRRPRKIERKLTALRCWPWFRGKEMTADWSSASFTLWRRVLSPLRKRSFVHVLEIGSWEGRSALFFLNFLPRSTLTCIDTFEGGEEHHARWADHLPRIEARFDHNLAPFSDRVEKLKCRSQEGLRWLAEQRCRYDVAFIDGSHTRDDVMADSIGVWPLLNPGGVVIWDDYKWTELPPDRCPQAAIDAFLSEHAGEYQVLAVGYQLLVEKLIKN